MGMDTTIETASHSARQLVDSMARIPVQSTPVTRRVINKWLRGLSEGQVFEHGLVNVRFDKSGRQVMSGWTSCGHVADKPEVCYGMACVPGHLMCADCFAASAQAQGPDTCDWCGMGVAKGCESACPTVCNVGPVIVLMVLCESHRSVERATFLPHTGNTQHSCCSGQTDN